MNALVECAFGILHDSAGRAQRNPTIFVSQGNHVGFRKLNPTYNATININVCNKMNRKTEN